MSATRARTAAPPGPAVLRDRRAAHHPRWRTGERLHHVFEQICDDLAAAGRGNHPAFEFTDPDGGIRAVSYVDLDAAANRLARHLVDVGVRPGDRVAVLLDDPPATYPAVLAVLKAHAAYVPVDPGYPPDRIAYIISDAGARFVLTRAGLNPLVEGLDGSGVQAIALDDAADRIAARSGERLGDLSGDRFGLDELARPDLPPPGADLAYVVYTSGSTGRPKGVAVEHASICNFVRVAAEVYGIRPDDRMYQGMTIAFDFSVEEMWVPWACGATLVPRPSGGSLLGADLHAFLTERRVTALACVPTLLATIDEDLPALRFLLVSGEACPRDLVSRWWREDRRFLNVYGPTEATVTATWTPLHPDRPVTIGVPLPTYTCVVLDPESGEPLPAGEPGELGIAGIGLATGYVNRPDLTRAAFIPDPLELPDNPSGRIYRTGDLVRVRHDGELEYLGRIDLQVKIRGYRIELTEIETVLRTAPDVAQAVVTTYSPRPGTLELAAFVTRRRGADSLDVGAVLDFLRGRLPTYMVPAYLDELARLPMMASDKVDRAALPAPSGRRSGGSEIVAPRTPVEAELARLLADTLGTDAVSVVDDVFDDLGADSLLMAQFCAAVRRSRQVPAVSMRDVYLNPSVERLARHVESLVAGRTAAGTGTPRDVPAPRRTRRGAVLAFGTAQVAIMLAGLYLVAAVAVPSYRYATAPPTLAGTYLRAVVVTTVVAVAGALLSIAAKWLLIGRWKAGEIRLWSAAHLRFWLVARLQRLSPLSWFSGSPLQSVHLRALGAKVGPGAVLLTPNLPVCTDLVSIGAGAVVRQDAQLRGYRPEQGRLRLGGITLGPGAVVGEKCVLDVDTELGAGAELRPSSSLHRGQRVPAGQTWHGSPGRPVDSPDSVVRSATLVGSDDAVGFVVVDPPAAGEASIAAARRRAGYATFQLLWLLVGWGPLLIAVVDTVLRALVTDIGTIAGVTRISGPVRSGLAGLAGPQVDALADLTAAAFLVALVVVSTAVYLGSIAIGFFVSLLLARVLRLAARPDVRYPTFSWRYALARTVTRLTNVRFQMQLFGDSSAILHYLAVLGWRMDRSVQTGSNFGVEQKHDTPYSVTIGRGTMVSDGLFVSNGEYGATGFRLRKVSIGANSFLGNDVVFPAGARTGENCLYGTKVAVPVDGPVRQGVGLLGSPAFEIPRSVSRDTAFPELRRPDVRRRRLAAKNRHNVVTALAFLGLGWLRVTIAVAAAAAARVLPLDDVTRVFVAGLVTTVGVFVSGVLAELAGRRFRPLQPRFCSILDRAFWQHERFWKLSLTGPVMAALNGTPMRSGLHRLLGVRIGRGVFDDGCVIPERTLVTIGDRTVLAAGSVVQGHSLEDGAFKCDRIAIGADVLLGVAAFVHYGTVVEDGAVIETDAFLMKGEHVPAGTHWVGNPAQPA